MSTNLEPIVYEIVELNGIPVRPDTRAVVSKASKEGRPVVVMSGSDYINLYHVFERLQADDKGAAKCEITRQQIGPEKWLVWFLPKGTTPPEKPLDPGYDPKRGRYKRLADQLASGERVVLESRVEAIKARRAWQLYVPKEIRDRSKLRSKLSRAGKSGGWAVQVVGRGAA